MIKIKPVLAAKSCGTKDAMNIAKSKGDRLQPMTYERIKISVDYINLYLVEVQQ